jgi:WD40 repeat protein
MLVTVGKVTYNEQGKQLCDEDTRIDILADIRTWVYDTSGSSQSFLWLTGDPGSGKSAITASVARECKKDGILWAQFFINRNNADTTDPKSYFPSIARQLADHVPDSDVALAIHKALKANPLLVDDISSEQASGLFLDAIEVASKLDPKKPVVVVIDGLDETSRPRLRFTADIFSKLFAKINQPNAKVFISSRTEDEIQKPFSKAFDVKHVKHIHLDTSAESSIRDVSTFLGRRIGEIVEQNDMNWEEWPGKERMQALCVRASGLFIWAATVMKFFQEQINALGRECLDDLLNALSVQGMGDINVLYSTILQIVYKGRTDTWEFETFRRLVGCVVVLQEPLCLAELRDLLDLQRPMSSRPVDIENFVRRLRTVLVAGTDAINDQTVPRLHKSFYEYIISERADLQFRVNTAMSHTEVAVQCLRQHIDFSQKSAPDNKFRSLLHYALEFWPSHLPPGMTAGVVASSSLKLPDPPQDFLQFPSHEGRQHPSVQVALSSDRKQIVSSSNGIIHFWDDGVYIKKQIHGGHTSTVNSVAFSLDGTGIISASGDKTLCIWDSQSGQPIGPPLNGHTNSVFSVAFSPDRTQIISGSSDCTLRLWDAGSGQTIGSPFKGHNEFVFSVAFSPDGKQIISGSCDKTVRRWDAQSGQPIGSPLEGHTDWVHSVAFSLDGKQIISGSADKTLRLWDAHSGQPIGLPFRGHNGSVNSTAFSPDGKQIISGSRDNTLRLWDAQSGQPIGLPFQGHDGPVTSAAFSPDGKQIISGSHDRTLSLWNAQSGQPVRSRFNGHTDCVNSVAFSPDGRQVISGSSDTTVRLWDIATGQSIKFPIKGHTDRVTAIALSPDGRKIASTSSNNTVRMWNAQTSFPIKSPLKCDIKEFISLAFSPDGSRLAAASVDGNVCLWDSESHNLLTSYPTNYIDRMSSITFSSDGKYLISSSINGASHTWNATNGKSINTHKSSAILLSDSNEHAAFNAKHGWFRKDADGAPLQWFPMDNPDLGYWAYMDERLIRRDRAGVTTIMDVSSTNSQVVGAKSGRKMHR